MADDEDTKSVPAPTGVPADKEPTVTDEAPEGEPQGEPEGDEVETKATADEEDITVDEPDEEDDEDEGEGDEPKRKASRAERYRRQAERLKAENEALRSRTSGSLPPDQAQLQRAFEQEVYRKLGDPPNPKDFGEDYVALSNARQAYEVDKRQVIRATAERFETAIKQEQERVADLVSEHKERVSRFRTKVKDFDAVMAQATVPVAPHVERLLLQSKKSERLQYALGKNQAKLAQLNRMDPESAAREIGRLEGRLSLPQPAKTQTQARRPITPLKGGGTTPPSGASAVNAYIKKLYGDR